MGKAEFHVEGLRETAKAFKTLEREVKRELPRELKKVAELVAEDARKRVPVRSGAAAESITARSTAQSASVVGGKGKVPYFGWLDFGSRNPRSGRGRDVGPWTGSGKGPGKGRFIYPAIDENEAKIIAAAEQAVADAERKAGF